ncbi:hypothetical protein [Burkholderia stagnalis]|uniref:hypothetical protein n=1 Tax=Burkholderia stagnalis TaxID=1503054 RepID=UPI0018C754B1|nr:hypothetical protein [Burkholderia stagnalis]
MGRSNQVRAFPYLIIKRRLVKLKLVKKLELRLISFWIDNFDMPWRRGLDSLRAILVKFREKRFDSESVNELLGAMRNGVAEDIEGRILENVDIVSGFCGPNMRIW